MGTKILKQEIKNTGIYFTLSKKKNTEASQPSKNMKIKYMR